MNIFKNKSHGAAIDRLMDESFYAEALREIESGIRRDGIWAQALAENNMDQAKAAAHYIKLRVQSMRDELLLRAEEEKENKKRQENFDRQQVELDLPRHSSCGGIIDRITEGSTTKWKCRKYRASGSFQIGVSYKK